MFRHRQLSIATCPALNEAAYTGPICESEIPPVVIALPVWHMKWSLPALLFLLVISSQRLRAQNPIYFATAITTDLHVKQGSVSDQLSLQTLQVGTLAPVAGITVRYDADPSLILLSRLQTTDVNGIASVQCLALSQQSGQVQAILSNGAVIRFNIIVDPPSGTQIAPDQQAYFEWQGSSTALTGTPIHAVIASSDAGTQSAGTPMPVQVKVVSGDANLVDGNGQPAQALSTQSDANAGIYFNVEFPATGDADDVSAITISAGSGSTSVLFHAIPQGQSPVISVVSPSGSGAASIGPDAASALPIRLQVTLADGEVLPGISLSAISANTDQEVVCKQVPVTDLTGVATCLATMQGAAGSGSVSFLAGGLISSPKIPFVAAAGQPALVRIVSGNRQSGSDDQTLPRSLTAWLMDAQGNPIPNAQVTWASDGATLTGESKTSDGQGGVTAQATLGNRPGAATVTVHAGSVAATFTLFNTSSGQLTSVDGDGQIGNPGQPFGKAIVIRIVAKDGSPVVGIPVVFTVLSGSAKLQAENVTTGPDGVAQTNVTAGDTQGPIGIKASAGQNSVGFHLFSLRAAAANFSLTDWNGNPATLVPGALMKISFQPADASALTPFTSSTAPFPTSAGGLRISVGQTPAPLASLSVSDKGIATATVQIPWEIVSQAISSVTVWINNSASAFTGLAVQSAEPALQLADSQHPSVWSPDGIPIQGPVAGGSMVQLRVTGTGGFQPSAVTNVAGSNNQTPDLPLMAFLDGYGLPLTTVTPDSSTPGVTDISLALPASLASGPHQLSIGAIVSGSLILSSVAELDVQ